MFSLLLLGFLIGMRHALEADHVAAVASLSSHTQSRTQAIKLGAIWGLGHTLTLAFFGSLVFLTDFFIPEAMAKWLVVAVGAMLIILGADLLRRLWRERIHYHSHRHAQEPPHFHAHSHKSDTPSKANHNHKHIKQLSYRALFVGVLHGMAGTAALILLTLETIKSPLQGITYILFFGIGSIAGMAALSYIISIPMRKSLHGLTWMHNGLQMVIGIATLGLGCYLIFENGLSLAI